MLLRQWPFPRNPPLRLWPVGKGRGVAVVFTSVHSVQKSRRSVSDAPRHVTADRTV